MKVDVIIPSYKPDDKLKKIFEMLSRQSMNVNKIIVMNTEEQYWKIFDNESIPDNVEVHHINKSDFDHGKTRNDGVSYSDADYFIMMTMDAVPADDKLVESLVKALESDEKIAAAYGRQLATDLSSIEEKFTRGFNYPDEPRVKSEEDIKLIGIKAFFCSNVCAAYKRDIFDKLGGFVNEAIFNEDMVYAHKLLINGYKIKYENNAKVYHTHEYSGMQQFKRNFDLAVSQKMNPEAFDGISSESEGVKYVKSAALYFIKNGHPFTIVPFVIKCVFKYAGYRKGKSYEKLSYEQILKYTGNKEFWSNRQ